MGIAVLRHGAFLDEVSAVVTVSTPARWDGHRSRAVRQMRWLTSTAPGRQAARLLGVRLSDTWEEPEHPEEVVGKGRPNTAVDRARSR